VSFNDGESILLAALSDLFSAISYCMSMFIDFMTYFSAFQLFFIMFAIIFACRFLLAPWLGNTTQGGVSDKASKSKPKPKSKGGKK